MQTYVAYQLCALLIVIFIGLAYASFIQRPKAGYKINPHRANTDYIILLDNIRNAASPTDLAVYETEVYDFELTHRSKADVSIMFTKLMEEIQIRHNQLTVQSLVTI